MYNTIRGAIIGLPPPATIWAINARYHVYTDRRGRERAAKLKTLNIVYNIISYT